MKACIVLILVFMAAVFLVGPIAVIGGCKSNKAEVAFSNSTSVVQKIVNKEKK